MKHSLLIILLAAVGAGPALAQHSGGGAHYQVAQASPDQKTGKGSGLIQQINRDRGTVTIKHGPLQGLDMHAMTMSFQVKDKAMLANLQPLQKVDFELVYDGRDYVITRIK